MSWKPPQHFNAPQTVAYQQPPPQKLHNGNLGPNFNYSKPTNLSNSAVLRMLQEQENDYTTCGSIKKEVIWPPPHDELEGEDVSNNDPYFNSQNGNPYEDSYRKPQKRFEPPPTVIRLRESPPITQHLAPVFKSQPAADTVRGGFRMRGDQKWPPPEYKVQAEAENQARVELARGPACRPLKVKKDYSSFFAKNALPNTYPGYKIPPGTQHYEKPPVTQF
ncbi:uncharacterized protein LOC135831369 [Planococcus citri]|uniref:uncharacterized protein LOC135831369 n=1 Tax=Planococcus citri TaxID=170843 RepID=UPI0031F8EDDB